MLKLPWNDAKPPAWVSQFRALGYQGKVTLAIAGTNPVNYPLQMSLTAGRRGPGWTETSLRFVANAGAGATPIPEVKTLNSLYNLMGRYAPPDALRELRQGQVLDKDPVTGFTYSVTGISQLADGTQVLGIREAGKVHAIDVGYDMTTGTLVNYRKVEQIGTITKTMTQAQLIRRQ